MVVVDRIYPSMMNARKSSTSQRDDKMQLSFCKQRTSALIGTRHFRAREADSSYELDKQVVVPKPKAEWNQKGICKLVLKHNNYFWWGTAGEIWHWWLLGVKGISFVRAKHPCGSTNLSEWTTNYALLCSAVAQVKPSAHSSACHYDLPNVCAHLGKFLPFNLSLPPSRNLWP